MLIEQAREDAMEIHKALKIEGLRKHTRKMSVRYGGSGKHFEGDPHQVHKLSAERPVYDHAMIGAHTLQLRSETG
jgi:hypothetical protein